MDQATVAGYAMVTMQLVAPKVVNPLPRAGREMLYDLYRSWGSPRNFDVAKLGKCAAGAGPQLVGRSTGAPGHQVDPVLQGGSEAQEAHQCRCNHIFMKCLIHWLIFLSFLINSLKWWIHIFESVDQLVVIRTRLPTGFRNQ